MFPIFTNVALLAGLAAIAAPIIIHLLLRRKSVRLRFSTLQFFVKQDEQSMRKRKLRNWLLLAARVVLFALIVLGFARPYFPEGGASGALAQSQQVILLIDTSLSMQATGPDGPQWRRAQELGRQKLAGLGSDDRAALVPIPAPDAILPEYLPPSIAAQRLDELQPTHGWGDLSEGLQQVIKLLAVSPPARQTTLVIVSDLQRSGCQDLATVPLPQELALEIIDLGERFIPNAAITELRVDAQNASDSQAVLTSFSDEDLAELPVEFKVDGKTVMKQSLPLPAGAVTNLPLTLPPLAPGWHGAEFSMEAKDGLAADNTRYTTFFVPEPIHCLVVETRPGQRVFQEETFFVATALNPHRGSNAGPSRFVYEKVGLEGLAQRLAAPQPRIEFVVLPGVKHLPGATVQALRAYLEAGGGLLMFLGDGVSANFYNSELNGWLPAQLGGSQAVGQEEAAWRIAAFKKTSPCFAPFRAPNSGNLYLPEFTHRFILTPGAESTVAAEFDDEMPMLAHRPVGRGRVALVNTTADTLWTDWQKHKTFVPWLQATAFYLAGRDAALHTEEAPTLVSGREVDLDLGTNQVTVKLQREGGPESSLSSNPQGQLRDVPMAIPGIYTLRNAQGLELRRLAMNAPVAESELALLAAADFQPQLARRAEPLHRAASAGLFGDPDRGRELWRMLLLVALILMLVEPLVANRTIA